MFPPSSHPGHLVTLSALGTGFIISQPGCLPCTTNRKRGLISARQGRQRAAERKIKEALFVFVFLNDLSANIAGIVRGFALSTHPLKSRIIYFGNGIYLQGLHLLGTVMVVSISGEGTHCPFPLFFLISF